MKMCPALGLKGVIVESICHSSWPSTACRAHSTVDMYNVVSTVFTTSLQSGHVHVHCTTTSSHVPVQSRSSAEAHTFWQRSLWIMQMHSAGQRRTKAQLEHTLCKHYRAVLTAQHYYCCRVYIPHAAHV